MATTKVFKSGNSLAIRMPAEIAYAEGTELTINRSGDVVTVFPKKRTQNMAEMVAALRALPTPSEIEIREPIEMPDRE
ncbi:MAG: AbrB/MazE/SpoVT family DNA-binding domain-containing protein [Alphaproteobacteria bacterium]|nr:AbrB/MazE/SpoVT family DNA-binding domain-containing protein [Alphaproteobacteria bacterium]MBV9693662.1 AbrB/MazE/SpoVT family DNA-binding domain-containing protein [Alphaproteobacteria bacterium]